MAFIAVANIVSGTPPIAPPADVKSFAITNGVVVAAGDALVFAAGRVSLALANSGTVHAIALEGGTGDLLGTVEIRVQLNAPGHVYKTLAATVVNLDEGAMNKRLVVATMTVADTADVDGPVNILRLANGFAWVTLNSPWA
jgi:hypothetical protein